MENVSIEMLPRVYGGAPVANTPAVVTSIENEKRRDTKSQNTQVLLIAFSCTAKIKDARMGCGHNFTVLWSYRKRLCPYP